MFFEIPVSSTLAVAHEMECYVGSAAYSNIGHPERSTDFNRASRQEQSCTPEQDASPSGPVRKLQAARRQREALFEAEIFADPAWDILLELYATHLEKGRITVSNLCNAAHVPATTALRWISKLENSGLAVRSDDPTDGRRSWIEISDRGLERMRRYFEMWPFGTVAV